jgi:hypothetical protein
MDQMNHVNWAALVEHEANERAHARQERLFDDIRRDEHENLLGRLRYAVQERQSKLTSSKGSVRWRMLRLRSVLARLL